MRSYLFIGGGKDGLRIPLADEPDTIQLPGGATEKETYVRETLSVGDASIYIQCTRHRLVVLLCSFTSFHAALDPEAARHRLVVLI